MNAICVHFVENKVVWQKEPPAQSHLSATINNNQGDSVNVTAWHEIQWTPTQDNKVESGNILQLFFFCLLEERRVPELFTLLVAVRTNFLNG